MAGIEEMLDSVGSLFKKKEYVEVKKLHISEKTSGNGVKRYEDKIDAGKYIDPIVAIGRPWDGQRVVLDGSHKAKAYKNKNVEKVLCTVYYDYFGIGYFLVKEGLFQPAVAVTKHIRDPLKRLLDESAFPELEEILPIVGDMRKKLQKII